MMNSRKLDELVALNIMGVTVCSLENLKCPKCNGETRYCGERSWCYNCNEWLYSPYLEYSDGIEAAWQVVEKMKEKEISFPSSGEAFFKLNMSRSGFNAGFWIRPYNWNKDLKCYEFPGWCASAKADTAPRAICIAALKAVGIDIRDYESKK